MKPLIAMLLLALAACGASPQEDAQKQDQRQEEPVPPDPRPFGRIHYSDLTYLGAFHPPDTEAYAYGEGAIAYIPTRGTLAVVTKNFGFTELDIPELVISPQKIPSALNVAREIMWGSTPVLPMLQQSNRLSGLTWLRGRLWCAAYEYYNPARRDNLGIACVTDTFGDPRGGWRVGPAGINTPIANMFHANKTHEYICRIPPAWSARYLPGHELAAGRYRQAGTLGGGNGPALYAFKATHTAPSGADLGGVPLMAFPFQDDMHADYLWEPCTAKDRFAVAWITKGKRQTVIIGAMQGLGATYYGNGRACVKDKGYHSEPYEPRLYFIDTDELGQVARGKRMPWEVEPYEVASPPELWLHPDDPGVDPTCESDWLADFAYDEAGGRLFASQVNAYRLPTGKRRMIVHAWKISRTRSP